MILETADYWNLMKIIWAAYAKLNYPIKNLFTPCGSFQIVIILGALLRDGSLDKHYSTQEMNLKIPRPSTQSRRCIKREGERLQISKKDWSFREKENVSTNLQIETSAVSYMGSHQRRKVLKFIDSNSTSLWKMLFIVQVRDSWTLQPTDLVPSVNIILRESFKIAPSCFRSSGNWAK